MRRSAVWSILSCLCLAGACFDERGSLSGARTDAATETGGTGVAADSGAEPADTAPACRPAVVSVTPPRGEAAVRLDVVPSVVLDAPDPDARLRLREGDVDVPTSLQRSTDGLTLSAMPLRPLRAGGTYTLRVEQPCGLTTASWTTIDTVFRLGLLGGTVDAPDTVYSLQRALESWLVRVDAVSEGTIELLIGASGGLTQEIGEPTTLACGRREADGSFTATADEVRLGIDGQVRRVTDLVIRSRIRADAWGLDPVTVQFTAPVALLLTGSNAPSPQELCAELGAACFTCAGGGDRCLRLTLSGIRANTAATQLVSSGPAVCR